MVIIPAHGSSKGIPYKNIKQLQGRPLIYYIIDVVRCIADDAHICISTNDNKIIKTVEDYGISVPFKRPDVLATDTAGTYEVLLHVLNCHGKREELIDVVILLQATSPFRTGKHIEKAMKLYQPDIDMIVSVKEIDSSPYYVCLEEDREGFLHLSKGDGSYTCHQDCPLVYEYNGAIYIINPSSLKSMPLSRFTKWIKYVVDREHSIDLDTIMDQYMAEYVTGTGVVTP